MSSKTLLIISCLLVGLETICAQMQPTTWLKAEDVNVGSSWWSDASANNIKISTSSTFELGNLINYNPSVSFENLTDSLLLNLNLKNLDHITAFVVFRNDTLKGEKSIWGSTSKTDRKLLVSNSSIYDEFNQFEYSFGAMPHPIVAVVSKYWEKSIDPQNTQIFLGGLVASFGDRFKGDFAELILFDKPLSEIDYAAVQTYLGLKYGIGILQTDYINPKGEVIWSKEDNADYPVGVFGIGRYESHGLYQKQATDSYGILSMCVSDFSETNQQNTGSLMRDSYVIASNNGEHPDYDISVSDGHYGSKLLNKCKWKIQSSGATLNQSNVILKINRYALFKDSISDVCMLIDQSGKGDYSQFAKIFPSSIDENGDLYFKNVFWGSTGLKTALFTFALSSEMDVELTYKTANCSNEPVHILGTILGNGSPYRLKVFDEHSEIIKDKTITEQTFDVEFVSLGSYLIEIIDSRNNMVRYDSGDHLLTYTTSRMLETDYWIVSHPIEIAVLPPSSLDIASYNWYFEDTWVSDENKLTAGKQGDYKLIYSTTNGCLIEESFFVFDKRNSNGEEDLPSSLDSHPLSDNEISVFPNPMRDKDFNIVFNLESPSDLEIELYRMDGLLVHRDQLVAVQKMIYNGELKNSGVYLVIIKMDGLPVYKSKLIRL